MLDFGVVKFISGLNTAAKQLIVVLLVGWMLFLAAIGVLYREVRNTEERGRKERIEEVASIRKEHAVVIASLQRDNDELRDEITTIKKDQYDFVNSLYQEQKSLNNKATETDKTLGRIAKINRRHVNSIKKDANDLIEVTRKSK